MDFNTILAWLKEQDPALLEKLWSQANDVRQQNVGDDVHLRGLIEFSNNCRRGCTYCGMHAANSELSRYRMTSEEILECAMEAQQFGYGTVVMQSGEDDELDPNWLANVVREIKDKTDLAVTLSVGERSEDELRLWKDAGADRYLLRFETSNRKLYEMIHPSVGSGLSDRIALLRKIKELGYEVGSGVMVGIPGQSYEILANDIEAFAQLDLDMIGVGPFIMHPGTPIAKMAERLKIPEDAQVPNNELMTYKAVALTRIMCPGANIPSTSALATINKAQGRELGLSRGANIVMPNLTPRKYRAMYEIYPAKACIDETADECRSCMRGRIHSIGRTVGQGRGDSPNVRRRNQTESKK